VGAVVGGEGEPLRSRRWSTPYRWHLKCTTP